MGERLYLFILGVIEVALIVLVFTRSDWTGQLLTAIVLIAGMMLLVPSLSRITEFGVFGLRARIDTLEHGAANTSEQVRHAREAIELTNLRLDTLFALSIADWQYQNLHKLASGSFGPYVRSMGLENDLRHLRNHGYIDVASVRDIPDAGEELCDHVRVTETGRAFVDFRESLGISAQELIVQDGRLRPATTTAREHEQVARPRPDDVAD